MALPGDPKQWHIGLVGNSEAGRLLGEELCAQGVARPFSYHIKLGSEAPTPPSCIQCGRHSLRLSSTGCQRCEGRQPWPPLAGTSHQALNP